MRARITFSKTGPLRYIGHLDLQTLWERSARRAGLPLSYSHGFHPQPKISFASALPLGFSSRAEVMDMRIESDLDPSALTVRLHDTLPSGIRILGIQAVPEADPALQTLVLAAEYEVRLLERGDVVQPDVQIARLLAAPSLPRERRGKSYDLRPLIEGLALREAEPPIIWMRLAAREGATGRPEEVLAEMGIAANLARIERTRLIFR